MVLVDGVQRQKIRVVITASTMIYSGKLAEFKELVIGLSQ